MIDGNIKTTSMKSFREHIRKIYESSTDKDKDRVPILSEINLLNPLETRKGSCIIPG